MAIVIVGLDSIGPELAKSLVEKGESVILIDDHEGRVAQAQAQGFQARQRAIVASSMVEWSEVQSTRTMVAITGSDRTKSYACASWPARTLASLPWWRERVMRQWLRCSSTYRAINQSSNNAAQ